MISACPEEHGDQQGKTEGYGSYGQEILQVGLDVEDPPGGHGHCGEKVGK